MKIKLRCLDDWSYSGWNRCEAVLSVSGLNVSDALCMVWAFNQNNSAVKEGSYPPLVYVSNCFFVQGGESFNLSDLAECFIDLGYDVETVE